MTEPFSPVDPSAYVKCCQFLNYEAELLDEQKLETWLSILAEDIDYRVPRRTTRERGTERSEFSEDAYLYREDKGMLRTRVERFQKEHAWSENPPSRSRHFVTNVRVEPDGDDRYDVTSNLLMYREQGDSSSYDLISGERHDTIRRTDNEFEIADRIVLLDHTILSTRNLSLFL